MCQQVGIRQSVSASRRKAECVSTLFLLKRGAEVLTVFFWKPVRRSL